MPCESRTTCQQPVIRIGLRGVGPLVAGLAVGRAEHDLSVQTLYVPTGLHELRGEPVEQLRMCRYRSAQAEVLRRVHKTGSKEQLPEPIHGNAGGQRVARTNQPLRQD